MMNKALINRYCEVFAEGQIFDVEYIWYEDLDGERVLETLDSDWDYNMFSCSNEEEFELIMSTI